MKIDRIRLLGFKSFVDPTELFIEPGLTGIVGPNGCGKSNVLEALRWVMGATSAKALRGGAMDDVIFSGTSGRPARNMAEVALVIDNSARKAPAAFNDAEKLEVIRRIERGAGSAYTINGKDVRLRDVQLLFADASTGSNSAALVRQGQISELINAKPQNRRRLLEEAAGITGLHSRRHEAELRLQAAENNLVRLEDVQLQLEEQLAALRRQARQASRYRNLSGHIRRAEATGLHLRWTDAREAVEQAEAQLTTIEHDVTEKTRKAAQTSSRQSEIAATLPPLRDAEARAAAAVQRLNIERDGLEREEIRAREQMQALDSQLAQIAQDHEREKNMRAEAQAILARLDEETTALENEEASTEHELERSAQSASEAERALVEKQAELDLLTEQSANLSAREAVLKTNVQGLAGRHGQLKTQLAVTREEREKLIGGSHELSRSEAVNRTIEDAVEKARSAEDGARDADTARLQAIQDEAAARKPLQEIDRRLNELKGEAKALSDVLSVEETGLWPPVIDGLDVQAGYETALGAALGDDLNVPMDEAAPAHWDLLAGMPAGAQPLPSGVRSLDEFVDGPAQLNRRLSQIGVVEKHEGKQLQDRLAAGQRLVTREGDLWRWDGFSASADAGTAAATRLAQRNRLAELDAEIVDVSATCRDLLFRLEQASRLAAEKTAQEEACRKVWHQAQSELTASRETLSKLDTASSDAISKLAALKEAEKRLEQNIAEIETSLRDAETESLGLNERRGSQQDVTVLRQQVAGLRIQVSKTRAAHEGHGRESAIRHERARRISGEKEQWRHRLEAADHHLTTLGGRREHMQTELASLRDLPDELEIKKTRLLDAISELEAKRQHAADALVTAENRLSERDAEAKEMQRSLADTREERARAGGVLEGERERVEEVAARIRDTLNCAPDQLLEKAELKEGKELPTLEQIETKLERLKRERENMGAVNLRAEQEADDLRNRLNEMAQERDDLEQALRKLRKAINELNKEGQRRLLAAFDKVNENFTRLFSVLFEGGTARLELTEADDPLEAGLEVFARPPGKRLQSLSLLSGGEQALTAIALIFAVFLSNPAPICVLDEVDAPLDDANVERFCNLLNEMRKTMSTRFLIITHHALTMSRMDRLYGVTMAERGISQLVSVDLTSAQRMQAAE